MKFSSLTIGQRVAGGFALLLVILLVISGLVFVCTRIMEKEVDFVDSHLVPVSREAGLLLAAMDEFRLNARVYGITGNPADIDLTQAALERVKTSQKSLRGEVTKSPRITDAIGSRLAAFDSSLTAYEAILTQTISGQADLAAQLASMQKARQAADAAVHDLLQGFFAASARDHENGNHAEAARRLTRISGMITIGDLIQNLAASTQQSRAERRAGPIETALVKLPPAFELLASIRSAQVNKDNIARMDTLIASLKGYESAGKLYLQEMQDLGTINTARARAGEDAAAKTLAVMADAGKLVSAGMAEVERATTTLNRILCLGAAAGLALGILCAFLIIRGVNLALGRTAESVSQGASQIAAASGQVSASSQSLAKGASEQAASLEEISSSMEELASMTKRNADSAQSGKRSATQARAAAEAGAG
ncbi:MAG TPA: hypothetical protein VIO38_00635, partial [Rariglobus sp.]